MNDNEFLATGEREMIEQKILVGKDARVGSRARWEYDVYVLGLYSEIEVGEVFQFTDFEQYDKEDYHSLFCVIDPSNRMGGDSDNCSRGLFGFANVGGSERLILIDSATDNTSTMSEIAEEQVGWRSAYGDFVSYVEVNGMGKEGLYQES